MRIFLTFTVLFFLFEEAYCVHNPLLPEPQKVEYGNGWFFLKGAGIGFAFNPEQEDKFAAFELAKAIKRVTGEIISVDENRRKGFSIIFDRTGNSDPLALPGEKAGPDSRESYKIRISPDGIRISAPSSAGLFYAVQTLAQMVEGADHSAKLPEAVIEDWPALPYRGFMMDMSHTQLPRVDEIKSQIDFMAKWKANQYYFYSEASIELDGYPLLMADARYTQAQVREIVKYAKERHIDVVPNMELYGHLHDLFRLEHYSGMAVMPHGGEFRPGHPGIKPLLENWIGQISDLFSSPFFHIGFDETWLLEEGAVKQNKSPGELYLEMVNEVTEIVEKNNKIPLIWADMLQKYPSIIPEVSENAIAVPWHYFPLKEENYDKLLRPFNDVGMEIFVQSAIINWNWLVPDFETSSLNTDLLISAGRKYNCTGFINSGWTDDTQALMRLGFPDIAYGFVSSWQSSLADRKTFFRDYSKILYSDSIAILVENAHISLMESGSLLKKVFGNTDDALWANPFNSKTNELIEKNIQNLTKARLSSEAAQGFILEALESGEDTISLYSMFVGAKLLDYLSLKYIYALEIDEFWKKLQNKPDDQDLKKMFRYEITHKYHSRISDMMDAISVLKNMFGRAWLNEYTPYRLEIALAKYDMELQFWIKLQRKLEIIHKQSYGELNSKSMESLSNFF